MSYRTLLAVQLAVALLCSGLSAQRTWIVDRNNGPGTDFTDLPPAVAAAAAGDIVHIRPAAAGQLYEAPATIDNKPLTIIGDPVARPIIIGLFEILNIAAGASFRMTGLKLGTGDIGNVSGRTLPMRGLVFQDNPGLIVLDQIEFGRDPMIPSFGGMGSRGASFERCGLVSISRSTLWCSGETITVRDTTLLATDSRFREMWSVVFPVPTSPETILAQRSQITLIDCEAIGTNGGWNSFHQMPIYPAPAILLCNATVSIGGRSRVIGGNFYLGGPSTGILVNNTSTCAYPYVPRSAVFRDPRSNILGTIGLPLAVEYFDPVPGVRWDTTPSQASLMTTQYTNPNSLTVLVAGSLLPSPVQGPLGTLGMLFVNPTTAFVLDIGVTGTLGEHTWSIPIPSSLPRPIYLPIQAVELVQNGQLLLTNVILPGVY